MSPECRAVHAGTKSAEAEVLVSMWMNAPTAAFHDAGVLMEMSQYAEPNSLSCNAKQLQADCAALDEVTKPPAELLMDKVTEAMLRKKGLV